MSKEKQCECCHEWWYGSDVKESLCPNCYGYFKQLKQQLEACQEARRFEAENHNESYKKLFEKWADEVKELKQQIEEKDKEIERLKQELEETNAGYDFTYEQSSGAIKELKQNQIQLAIQELEKVKDWLNEPFDEDGCFKNGGDLIDYIDQQIKELKGE